MDAWHFTEMPYPFHPDPDTVSSVRVNLPSKHFDPKIGHELYNRYLDEHMLADELARPIAEHALERRIAIDDDPIGRPNQGDTFGHAVHDLPLKPEFLFSAFARQTKYRGDPNYEQCK